MPLGLIPLEAGELGHLSCRAALVQAAGRGLWHLSIKAPDPFSSGIFAFGCCFALACLDQRLTLGTALDPATSFHGACPMPIPVRKARSSSRSCRPSCIVVS